jgi:tRNA1Val (adenine37-N6)-methyltransferase
LDDDYLQPPSGYRFSEDSVLLARFLPAACGGRAADLGAGCGVVGLEALASGRLRGLDSMFLVERDRSFQGFLDANAQRRAASGPSGPRVEVIWADWREVGPGDFGGRLSVIVSNPPYVPAGAGRQPAPGRNQARREGPGGLEGLLDAAARLLEPGGRLFLSWPRRRLAELTRAAGLRSFFPAAIQTPARERAPLVLAELLAKPLEEQRCFPAKR